MWKFPMRISRVFLALGFLLIPGVAFLPASDTPSDLQVGFAEVDITPAISKTKPVYMAGFGQNRVATGVLAPLMARAIVFADGKSTVAMVSLDLVGLSYANTLAVRKRLPGFNYVLVSCTHNHEGPDTVGLWGPSPFKSGVDRDYIKHVEDCAVRAIEKAKRNLEPATARVGVAQDASLLHDSREPIVKHDELVVLSFMPEGDRGPSGLLVQWNCHPETLADRNTLLSADYVASTVLTLKKHFKCPVIYLTGTVGGLMTTLNLPVKDDMGKEMPGGSVEKTVQYGKNLAMLAGDAVAKSKPAVLTPIVARAKDVYLPLDNPQFLVARQLGLLVRDSFVWTGDWREGKPLVEKSNPKRMRLKSEVGWLDWANWKWRSFQAKFYPELVLDKVQNPADPGADFPRRPSSQPFTSR